LRSRERDLGPLRLKLEGKHTGFLASFEQRRENREMRKVGSYKRLWTCSQRRQSFSWRPSYRWRCANVVQPKPKPSAQVCLSLTSVTGAGVKKTARTNGKGVAVLRINPKKPGIVTASVVETNEKLCGPKRIGVVGVFLPPLTG
jgi:hypothetical protein